MTACTLFDSGADSTGDEAFANAGIRFSFCLIGRTQVIRFDRNRAKSLADPLAITQNLQKIDREIAQVA
jgi:hypothetical protein